MKRELSIWVVEYRDPRGDWRIFHTLTGFFSRREAMQFAKSVASIPDREYAVTRYTQANPSSREVLSRRQRGM